MVQWIYLVIRNMLLNCALYVCKYLNKLPTDFSKFQINRLSTFYLHTNFDIPIDNGLLITLKIPIYVPTV